MCIFWEHSNSDDYRQVGVIYWGDNNQKMICFTMETLHLKNETKCYKLFFFSFLFCIMMFCIEKLRIVNLNNWRNNWVIMCKASKGNVTVMSNCINHIYRRQISSQLYSYILFILNTTKNRSSLKVILPLLCLPRL